MKSSRSNLEQIFETQIQTLALTLRPGTLDNYRATLRHFLTYLRATFPQLRRLSQLRRNPHLLGWFRSLSEQQHPLCNTTRNHYLIRLRRLLDDLSANGHPVPPDLIHREDFPLFPAICPDRSPRRKINFCSRNCAEPITSSPIRSCSSAPPESASVNAAICRWTAYGKWEATSGRSMFPSANCTPNAWCQPMPRCGGSWSGSLPCAVRSRPQASPPRKASCCHVVVVAEMSL